MKKFLKFATPMLLLSAFIVACNTTNDTPGEIIPYEITPGIEYLDENEDSSQFAELNIAFGNVSIFDGEIAEDNEFLFSRLDSEISTGSTILLPLVEPLTLLGIDVEFDGVEVATVTHGGNAFDFIVGETAIIVDGVLYVDSYSFEFAPLWLNVRVDANDVVYIDEMDIIVYLGNFDEIATANANYDGEFLSTDWFALGDAFDAGFEFGLENSDEILEMLEALGLNDLEDILDMMDRMIDATMDMPETFLVPLQTHAEELGFDVIDRDGATYVVVDGAEFQITPGSDIYGGEYLTLPAEMRGNLLYVDVNFFIDILDVLPNITPDMNITLSHNDNVTSLGYIFDFVEFDDDIAEFLNSLIDLMGPEFLAMMEDFM